MLNINTQIDIQAPASKVWDCLLDFEAYPKWNPFLRSIKKADEGTLRIEMNFGGSISKFTPKIIKLEREKELRWLGKLGGIPGLFTGEHFFILSSEKGKTKFIQGEKFSGVLAWLMMPFMKAKIKEQFESMNMALKAYVEYQEK